MSPLLVLYDLPLKILINTLEEQTLLQWVLKTNLKIEKKKTPDFMASRKHRAITTERK